MKKILFFAIALVASALVFTSCEKNGASALVGTWSRDTEKDAGGWYETQTLIINAKDFVFQGQQHDPEHPDSKDIMLMEGNYDLDGDVIIAHYLRHGWNHNGQIEYVPNWETFDEKIKYSIDGKQLTIIRYYGEDYQADPEVFTKQ